MIRVEKIWRSMMFWCERIVLWCCASRQSLEGGMVVYKGRQLAEGGFSYVYVAYEASTGRRVVLKETRIDEAEQMAAFLREVEAHRRFGKSHRNLMPLLDYVAVEKKRLAMMLFPMCARGSLRRAIDFFVLEFNEKYPSKCSTWNLTEFAKLFNGVASGLKCMHDAGYAHRDIKPENVLISDDGQAILTDFGSVALAHVRLDKRRDALLLQDHAATHSTMTYRAPELWDPPEVASIDTTKADVWALGCLLWAMAFGYSPFEADFPQMSGSSTHNTFSKPKPRLVETSHLRVLAAPPVPPLDSLPHIQRTSISFYQSVLDAARALLILQPDQRPSIDHVLDGSASNLLSLASLGANTTNEASSFSSSSSAAIHSSTTAASANADDPER